MYFPKREEKKLELPKYKDYEKIDIELDKLSKKEISDIKNEFKKRYIDEEELKNKLQDIEISQLNRFYSIVENRKFVFDSGYIQNLIQKQIDRGIGKNKFSNNDEILDIELSEKEKSFYEYFQENFLDKKICENKTESFLLMNMIKRYKRYLDGVKNLTDKNLNNK